MAENIDVEQTPKNILTQLIAQGLNPLQQSGLKAVQKAQGEQIQEAIQGGIPAENILKQLGIPQSEGEAVQQISSNQSGAELVKDPRSVAQKPIQQVPQRQQPQQRQNPLQMLSRLVQGIADIIPTSPSAKIANIKASGGGTQNPQLLQRAQQLSQQLPKGVSIDLGQGVKVTGQPQFTPEERTVRKEIGKQERDLSSLTTDIKIIDDDINSLLETFDKIPQKFRGPIAGRTRGAFQGGFLQQSPDLVAYQDSKGFFLSNIARSLGGERGVLTDRDIERVDGLFPGIQDKDNVVKQKKERIKGFINRRIEEHKKRVKGNILRLNKSIGISPGLQREIDNTSIEELRRIAEGI